jgi:hypothetical protein
MKVVKAYYETKNGHFWQFLNDDGEGGVRFSCRQGELEETIIELIQKGTEEISVLPE